MLGQWYRNGEDHTATVTGEKTRARQTHGIKSIVDADGNAVTVSEKWLANDYPNLCGVVTAPWIRCSQSSVEPSG